MNSNKKVYAKFIFATVFLLMIGVLSWSLMIYSSLFKFLPWYEPCGMQFLGIFIISVPLLFLCGIAVLVLNRFIRISIMGRLLPFIAILTLSLPILIDSGISKITATVGAFICVILLVWFLMIGYRALST